MIYFCVVGVRIYSLSLSILHFLLVSASCFQICIRSLYVKDAKTLVTMSDEEINTILHSRKSLLCNNKYISIKKNGSPDFDVTMGSLDGTELCEPVSLHILNILGEKNRKHRE